MRNLVGALAIFGAMLFMGISDGFSQDIHIPLSKKSNPKNLERNLLIGDNLSFVQSVGENLVGVEGNLKQTVNFMTNPSLKGRAAGSEGEKAVADYIYNELEKAGVTMLSPKGGEDFYIAQQDTLHSRNIIGIIEGYDPTVNNEYVVIAANMDNIGVNKLMVNGQEQLQIFPGANSNASGCAALLEIAKEAQKEKYMFRRSVIVAFFGGEDVNTYGSWYFLNRAFSDVGNIVAMINLNMIGRPNANGDVYAYLGDGNVEMKAIVNYISKRPLSIVPVFSPVDFVPSSHRNFYAKGVPVLLLSTGKGNDYHTVKDTPDKLDYTNIARTGEFAYSVMYMLANIQERLNVKKESDQAAGVASERVYTQNEVDEKATFLHGDEVQFLTRWVYQYLKYPQSAIDEGIQGVVMISFTVDTEGRVKDVKVDKGVSEELDAEAVKVVSVSPKWKPGKLAGEKVNVKISLPVEFKLSTHSTFKLKK